MEAREKYPIICLLNISEDFIDSSDIQEEIIQLWNARPYKMDNPSFVPGKQIYLELVTEDDS